jgi:hypothetical protein
MSCYTSPVENSCCTKPPNPWLIGAQGSQGCVCDANCLGPDGPIQARYQSSFPTPRLIPVEIASLDATAVAFSNSASSVNSALNLALIPPRSYNESLGIIFSQNAAAAVNATNAAAVARPQATAVLASTSAMSTTTAARLAHRAASDIKAAVNSIKNVNIDELSVLVLKAKVSADALYVASQNANNAAQLLYQRAGSLETTANTAVTTATAALRQVELDIAVADCNAIPGSGDARLTRYQNTIAITTARRQLELATTSATAAETATNQCQFVATATATALSAAYTASNQVIDINTYFTNARDANLAYANAIQAYHNDSSNNTDSSNNPIFTLAQSTKIEADAANALLPPISEMTNAASTMARASYLANIAAANARTLSSSLDLQAKAIAAPTYNPVTPQMIATQTAAAERFGAAAAAAASRAARASNAPPIPPPLPPPGNAKYSVRMPIQLRNGHCANA